MASRVKTKNVEKSTEEAKKTDHCTCGCECNDYDEDAECKEISIEELQAMMGGGMAHTCTYSLDDLFTMDDLYRFGEHEVIDIIEANKSLDVYLEDLWLEFKTTREVRITAMEPVKDKCINPLVLGYRLFQSIKS